MARRAHGHARVAGVGLLHGVHGQEADGVDAELIEVAVAVHRVLLTTGKNAKNRLINEATPTIRPEIDAREVRQLLRIGSETRHVDARLNLYPL